MILMEQLVSKENLEKALKQIERNKRKAPGIDGMRVEELREYLSEHGEGIRQQLLSGTYEPQAVKRVEIPKDGGGLRLGRSQHQAVKETLKHVRDGKTWVVDMDLSKFFDRVNHDMLMARVARQVEDKGILRLVRRYLEAGVMIHGIVVETTVGTPQGDPLSPLLSNIILDDLDKELERRGHAFVRYADDFQAYVSSSRSGRRVMESLQKYVEGTLKLKVNQEKSSVRRIRKTTYLGFSFYKKPRGPISLRLASKTLQKVRRKFRELTTRRWSISIEDRIQRINQYLKGWIGYFYPADMKTRLERIMGWLRRRLRMCLWKQWKDPRTRLRKLRGLGVEDEEARKVAGSRKGYWALSLNQQIHKALDNQYWSDAGLIQLIPTYSKYCRV